MKITYTNLSAPPKDLVYTQIYMADLLKRHGFELVDEGEASGGADVGEAGPLERIAVCAVLVVTDQRAIAALRVVVVVSRVAVIDEEGRASPEIACHGL